MRCVFVCVCVYCGVLMRGAITGLCWESSSAGRPSLEQRSCRSSACSGRSCRRTLRTETNTPELLEHVHDGGDQQGAAQHHEKTHSHGRGKQSRSSSTCSSHWLLHTSVSFPTTVKNADESRSSHELPNQQNWALKQTRLQAVRL